VIHGDYAAIVRASTIDSLTQYELWQGIWHSLAERNLFELEHAIGRHNALLATFVVRLADIQLVRAEALNAEADGRRGVSQTIFGTRGPIVDAAGTVLAEMKLRGVLKTVVDPDAELVKIVEEAERTQQLQLEQYRIALFYERMEPLFAECEIAGQSSA
jgi:hypothetical protein